MFKKLKDWSADKEAKLNDLQYQLNNLYMTSKINFIDLTVLLGVYFIRMNYKKKHTRILGLNEGKILQKAIKWAKDTKATTPKTKTRLKGDSKWR